MKAKSQINFAEFVRLDIRVGIIVKAEAPEASERIFRLRVDLGEDLGERIILAGLKGEYSEEELEGKQALFLVNLKPKKIMGEESQGMLLAVDDNGPVLLIPEKKVAAGKAVS